MLNGLVLSLLLTSNIFLAQNTSTDAANLRQERQEARQEQREARREEFKEKLQEIKSERKQKVIENMAARFEHVKSKWIAHWNKYLERLTSVLDKIEERYGASEQIDIARASVAEAQVAVDKLSEKTYDIDFDSEDTLREDIKILVTEFKADLMATRETVKNAKADTQEAFRLAKSTDTDEE